MAQVFGTFYVPFKSRLDNSHVLHHSIQYFAVWSSPVMDDIYMKLQTPQEVSYTCSWHDSCSHIVYSVQYFSPGKENDGKTPKSHHLHHQSPSDGIRLTCYWGSASIGTLKTISKWEIGTIMWQITSETSVLNRTWAGFDLLAYCPVQIPTIVSIETVCLRTLLLLRGCCKRLWGQDRWEAECAF